MKVTKEKKKNLNRSKLFGVVINPKFDEMIDWKSMSSLEMKNKLKELKFPDRFVMTDILNEIRFQLAAANLTPPAAALAPSGVKLAALHLDLGKTVTYALKALKSALRAY